MAKEKILLFGITGMAGHIIYDYFLRLDGYEIIGTSYRKKIDNSTVLLDVSDFEAVEAIVKKERPKYIINAVGVLIRGSRDSSSNTILINSYLPHFLVGLARKYNAKLIHISTDCVFSGKNGGNTESSFRDADDVYGRSKALGEIENETDVTIRTSIIGPELKNQGEGLFHWFMMQDGAINGFNNVYWSGVTTLQLAKGIRIVLENNIIGIYHLTNGEKISKYNLMNLFKKIWNKNNITINEIKSIPKDKSFINTKFPDFNVNESYEEMLIDQYNFMEQNRDKFDYKQRYAL